MFARRSPAPLASVVVVVATAAATAERFYVDASVTSSGDGSSWSQAFDRVQPALAAATAGDEIWVAEGLYFGGFDVPAGVSVYGGFQSGDGSLREREPQTRTTALDGQDTERVLNLADDSLVDGFWIQNGMASSPGGGGALVDGTAPTIRACVFQGNRTTSRGSALGVTPGGAPIVDQCLFTGNGGLGAHVIDLRAAGGEYLGITVYDNDENGLHFMDNSDPVIVDGIFARNTGRGICDISGSDDPLVENCLFWDNGVSLYHYNGNEFHDADAINNLSYAQDNLDDDPQLVDPSQGDFRLSATSPAIGAGQGLTSSTRDLYSNSRRLDGDGDGVAHHDIGAHEYARARQQVTGDPVPGGTLTLDIEGDSALGGVLLLGLGTFPDFYLDPLGYLGVDFTLPVFRIPVGKLPAQLSGTLPHDIPSGTEIVFQTLARGGGSGVLTNVVVRTVR